MKLFVCLALLVLGVVAEREIKFVNRCGYPIWINPLTSKNGQQLPGGIQRINQNGNYIYRIPDAGWEGRFWPKTGCNNQGVACRVGQSIPPCGPTGCQPPAETKVEFFFPAIRSSATSFYDISLVDGYSLPMEIIPNRQAGSCVRTNCRISLNSCPSNEAAVGDLAVRDNGQKVMCLSPCKKWNYPAPYGLGRSEQNGEGLQYCCPYPPVSSQQCRQGLVVRTQYVNMVRRNCPSAYSYAFDDEGGLHNCPSQTNFVVNVC